MLVVYFSNSVPCEVCLCSVQVRTFDFKWLRGVHREAFTGAHVDNVYMGRGTKVKCQPLGTVLKCSVHCPGSADYVGSPG